MCTRSGSLERRPAHPADWARCAILYTYTKGKAKRPGSATPGRPHPQPLSGAERGATDRRLPSPRRRGAGGEVTSTASAVLIVALVEVVRIDVGADSCPPRGV